MIIVVFFLGLFSCLAQQVTLEQMTPVVLNPLRRQIVDSYPILSLRQKFVGAVNDKSVTLNITSRSILGQKNTPLAFSGSKMGNPVIVIVYDNFLQRMTYARSVKGQKEYTEYLEDLLIAVYLHEYHHIKKQGFFGGALGPKMVEFEKDCWAYTVKEILLPMQAQGRAKLLPGTFEETILILYRSLNGNTADKRWHDFFWQSYNQK